MRTIPNQADYDRTCAEIVQLQKYLADLTSADRLMDAATAAMQVVDETIEGPDFEAAIISVRLAISVRQESLDAFDGRYAWGEHGLASRVYAS